MKPFISLCMIVKDEEKVLRTCLESVKKLVDEIIVVDTGSTDATKSIASEYTKNIYDFEWINDFSAAKNEAIKKATGTWILVLDADEYVQQEDHDKLKEYLLKQDPTEPIGILLPIMNIIGQSEHNVKGMGESSATRLFPNHKDIFFTRPIHEQLVDKHKKMKYVKYPFTIFHTGYTVERFSLKDKANRNLTILENMRDKQSFTPYDHFTIANEYQAVKNYKKAKYYYERAFKKITPKVSWYIHCLDRMMMNFVFLNEWKEAYDLIEQSLLKWNQFSDFYYYEGLMYKYFGLNDFAKKAFETAIEIADEKNKKNQPYWIVRLEYGASLAYEELSQIYELEHNMSKIVFYFSKILNSDRKNLPILYKLTYLLSQSEESVSIVSFLEKLFPAKDSTNMSMLFHISLLVGHEQLSQHYFEECIQLGVRHPHIDLLRFALVTRNQLLFDENSQVITPSSENYEEIIQLFSLAAIIWENEKYLAQLNDIDIHKLLEGNRNKSTESIILSLLNKQTITQNIDKDISHLHALIIDLFNLKYFEKFDWMMTQLSNDTLIHHVADYFYSQHQLEIAMDYYSILLQKNSLQASGYENLGLLYIQQGITDEGIQFLKKAIELNPSKVSLYPVLIRNCNDDALKNAYKVKFTDQFPQYRSLPFIRQL